MISEIPVKDGRIVFSESGLQMNNLKSTIKNLNKLIADINAEISAVDKFQAQLHILIRDLNLETSRCLQYNVINTFGSSFNGFRSKTSDIDVVINLQQDGIDNQLCIFKNHLNNSEVFQLKQVIRSATVPIITVYHLKSCLDCDISFASPTISRSDVILNTNLLKTYSDKFPEISRSFRFLKVTLNCTKFGSVRTAGLSTYTHIILFIYFLTHKREPLIPHIDPKTLNFTSYEKWEYTLSAPEMIIDYLLFISCELDSSKFDLDIRTPHEVTRISGNHGHLGRLKIPDPYIHKDLGHYMKDQQLYHYKLFCYHLLQQILSNCPENVDCLKKWCIEYDAANFEVPPFHLKCRPAYLAKPKNTKRKKTTAPKTSFQRTDSWTIAPNANESTDKSATNRWFYKSPSDSRIAVDWVGVLGPAHQTITDLIDTSVSKLQCVLVFARETELELVEDMFRYLPLPEELVVASCLSSKPGAQLYLTTYHNTISKQIDTSAVKRVCVYNPSFQLPVSFWRILRASLSCSQLYFMVSDSISPSTKHLDGLAELYTSNSAAETRYHSTLQLSEVKRQLKDKRFQGLPHNIELHQIPDMPGAT